MDTGIRTDRIEAVREIVSGLLEQVPNVSLRASGYVHMFGVAEAIATYTTGNAVDHAHRGAEMAKQILQEAGIFSTEEIGKICQAIFFHSDKKMENGPLEEILKDADVLQHCLFDPGYVAKKEKERFKKLKKELGIKKN